MEMDTIYDSLKNVGYDNFKLFIHKWEPTEVYISRIADILVGFYAKEDVTFDLYVGDDIWCTHKLKANEINYALKTTFLPIKSIPYAEIRINCTVPLYLIYSEMYDDTSYRFLHYDNHYVANGCIIKEKIDDVLFLELPTLKIH